MSANTDSVLRRPDAPASLTLDRLGRGQTARVAGFTPAGERFELRLREVGFAEGDEVEVLQRALLSGGVSVRLNRTIIALRREEAAALRLEPMGEDRARASTASPAATVDLAAAE